MKEINQQPVKQPSTVGLAIGGIIFLCLGIGLITFVVWSILTKSAGLPMTNVAIVIMLLIGFAFLIKGITVFVHLRKRLAINKTV